jgi:hypothetical protein
LDGWWRFSRQSSTLEWLWETEAGGMAIRVARKLNIPKAHLYRVEVAALLGDIAKIGGPTRF